MQLFFAQRMGWGWVGDGLSRNHHPILTASPYGAFEIEWFCCQIKWILKNNIETEETNDEYDDQSLFIKTTTTNNPLNNNCINYPPNDDEDDDVTRDDIVIRLSGFHRSDLLPQKLEKPTTAETLTEEPSDQSTEATTTPKTSDKQVQVECGSNFSSPPVITPAPSSRRNSTFLNLYIDIFLIKQSTWLLYLKTPSGNSWLLVWFNIC